MRDVDLVREALKLSGLTLSQFALHVLGRTPRHVRRWLNGEAALTPAPRGLLEAYVLTRRPQPATAQHVA